MTLFKYPAHRAILFQNITLREGSQALHNTIDFVWLGHDQENRNFFLCRLKTENYAWKKMKEGTKWQPDDLWQEQNVAQGQQF